MESCDGIREHLADLGALRPEDRPAWVREHLAGCTACARALWAHQIMLATIDALLIQRERAGRGTSDGLL